MRFTIFAAAIAAVAAAQQTPVSTIEQTITSATTTYTITRTVERVVKTQYATIGSNNTATTPAAGPVASTTLMPYSNGTATTGYAPWGTGMGNQTVVPMQPTSGAGSLLGCGAAVMFVAAGLGGMLVF